MAQKFARFRQTRKMSKLIINQIYKFTLPKVCVFTKNICFQYEFWFRPFSYHKNCLWAFVKRIRVNLVLENCTPIRLSEASKIWGQKENTNFPVLPMIYLIALFTLSEASVRGKNFQWQDWVAYVLSVLKCLEPNKRQFSGKTADGKSEAILWQKS